MLRLRPRPRFSLIPALAAAGMIALTISLGNWQSGRAKEKDVIEARHERTREAAELALGRDMVKAEEVDGRRIAVRGNFEPAQAIYWDNQIVNHVPGFAVIVPFRIAGSDMRVLVDRGLLRIGGDRSRMPVIDAPTGEVELHGRAYLPPRRTLELKEGVRAEELKSRLWQNLTPDKYSAAYRIPLQPFILREASLNAVAGSAAGGEKPPAAPAGLLRMTDNTGLRGEASETGMTAAKHRGYAFQWYCLAALAALLFLLFTFLTNDKGA
jgi:cytochrome oxidase assembly protein ShyY1